MLGKLTGTDIKENKVKIEVKKLKVDFIIYSSNNHFWVYIQKKQNDYYKDISMLPFLLISTSINNQIFVKS